jgi:replication factor A1
MKISDLKAGMNVESLKGKIAELKEPREVNTKFGTTIVLTEATLEDDTGTVKLVLWGEQADNIEEGSEVEITGAFTKEFREEIQLSIGKKGTIKAVE